MDLRFDVDLTQIKLGDLIKAEKGDDEITRDMLAKAMMLENGDPMPLDQAQAALNDLNMVEYIQAQSEFFKLIRSAAAPLAKGAL